MTLVQTASPVTVVAVARGGPSADEHDPGWIAFVHADVEVEAGTLTALAREAERRELAAIRARVRSEGSGDYWSREGARRHDAGRVLRDPDVGVTIISRRRAHGPARGDDRGGGGPDAAYSQECVVVHRCARGMRPAGRRWLEDGAALGRLVREHGGRGVHSAGREALERAGRAIGDWRRPTALPYSAAELLGVMAGCLRGLTDSSIPRRGLARSALVAVAFLAVVAALFLVGAGLSAIGATVVGEVTGRAGRASRVPVTVPLAVLIAVLLVEVARTARRRRARRLGARLEGVAVLLVCAALTLCALRLAALIGLA